MSAIPQQPDPFAGPKLKIERAKHHIADYRLAHKAFTESGAVRFVAEIDPNTGYTMTGVAYDSNPPTGDMRVTAADVLYNLRAALDQAVSCCAKLAGQSPKDTYFPHGRDKAGFESSLRDKCKKIPNRIRGVIAALEPYHGGTGYLFRVLHDLNLVDKHTDLLNVGPAVKRVTVEKDVVPTGAGVAWERREGKIIIRDPADLAKVDEHVQVTMSVTFTDVEAIRGEPVTHVLYQLAERVALAVTLLEAEMAAWLVTQTV